MHHIFSPGKLVTLSHPQRTQWVIDEIIDEIDEQEEENSEELLSFATAKISCTSNDDERTKAMMRVYLQVPYTNTELEDSATRAQQATACDPAELDAYKTLSRNQWTSKFTPKLLAYMVAQQKDLGLVPGGFIVCIVWQVVPGLWLGDSFGSAPFWDSVQDIAERNRIRAQFQDTYQSVVSIKVSCLHQMKCSH
ncbi:unnamed protein product [Penicillium salamii]|nr:unnamed protein product [Penicillium salamii]